ncbi:hypothetical protein CryarDRAFT_3604 [Cryptosporangium arvum DSM 44712]|uniref:Uncharacterized protein n=1 Tax=Cryptosporangium arvum DSM 44712 TaxID=927661 RepID=A0A010YQF0_9ACTN|nr:hypothetical protein CryarDRAFT_3604 [Cryptosporangium arvum DSM 44712]
MPRFCELTPETVSLSPAAGGSAVLTYASRFGTVAGTVDPDVPTLDVLDRALRYPTTDHGEPAVVRDGVFVLPNGVTAQPGTLTLRVGATPARRAAGVTVDATRVPSGVSTRTDRPQPSVSPGDFARCGDRPGVPPLVDAHAWRPTVTVDLGSGELLRLARTVFYDFSAEKHGSDTAAVTGLVTDERSTKVSLGGRGHRTISVPVVGGTLVLPGVNLGRLPTHRGDACAKRRHEMLCVTSVAYLDMVASAAGSAVPPGRSWQQGTRWESGTAPQR